jgi:DNA-directed RNA polymerase specialized sigma24 family protein
MLDDAHSSDFKSVQSRSPAWVPGAFEYIDALYELALYLNLVEETYAGAVRAADGFAAGTSIKAALYRILRQTFGRERPNVWDPVPATEQNERAASDRPLDRERVRATCSSAMIQAALMRLPADDRMLILCDLEELSEVEMAYVLDRAGTSVQPRLSRARAALWAMLIESRELDGTGRV